MVRSEDSHQESLIVIRINRIVIMMNFIFNRIVRIVTRTVVEYGCLEYRMKTI